jgi:mono/diheme cytochrome c family protein
MATDAPSAFQHLRSHRRSLIIWLAGVATAFAAIGVAALVVIEGGLFDATASTPHNPLVALAVHTAYIRSVQVRAAGIQAPARFTAAQVRAGLADYNATCTACHGAPGMPRWSWANAMTPSPPYLSDVARRWRPRELFWILGQGVKMTGMPAWGESRTDAQLWNLVAFLEAMPLLKPADYARMQPVAHGQEALEGASRPKPKG